MTVDKEKLWEEISERWRAVVNDMVEEEGNNILFEDEITAKQFGILTGLSYSRACSRLESMVVNREATRRKVKIDGHRMNVYRLIPVQPDKPEHP